MSCITWQTETYLILKQYQSGEILHAFLPALNDCTEKKKGTKQHPCKKKNNKQFSTVLLQQLKNT